MSHYPEPVYELVLDIDREIIDSFDDWLTSFVEASLQQPGLTDARVQSSETDHGGRARRVIHFQLDSRQALTDFQSGQEARMFADAVTRSCSDWPFHSTYRYTFIRGYGACIVRAIWRQY